MINNWEHHNLRMAFDNIKCTNGKPSDIDMFYITDNNFLIIGELKNGDFGTFKPKQKELLTTFVDNYKFGGIVVYAVHHCSIENGDELVDTSQCEVKEYYYKGKWYRPNKHIIVQDIFNKFDKEQKMNIIEEKEKTIFRNEREGKVNYSIGLSKKKEDGSFENGYIPVRFKKGTDLQDKTKIKIKEAWLDFFKIEKKTIPYIFINQFELASDLEAMKQVQEPKIQYDEPEELPFY